MELASYFPVAGHQLLRADRPVQEVKHRPFDSGTSPTATQRPSDQDS